MKRKEHSVGEYYSQTAHCHAVIAMAHPVAVETRGSEIADERAKNRQHIDEKRSVRLQPIIAADVVVVAERGQYRRIREGVRKLQRHKLHRLLHEQAIRSVRALCC